MSTPHFTLNYIYIYIYIYIKSNRFLNRYPPSDHAEMKSQPFKLLKITAMMAVWGGSRRFFWLAFFSVHIPTSIHKTRRNDYQLNNFLFQK
ncbi:hypothetical protein Hanom_Chr12g01157461 [Helianthus anomalus]